VVASGVIRHPGRQVVRAAGNGTLRGPAARSAEIMRVVAEMTRPGVFQREIAERAGVAQSQVPAAQAVLARAPARTRQHVVWVRVGEASC